MIFYSYVVRVKVNKKWEKRKIYILSDIYGYFSHICFLKYFFNILYFKTYIQKMCNLTNVNLINKIKIILY